MSRYKVIRSIFHGRNTDILHGIIVHPQGLGSEIAIKRLHKKGAREEPAVRAFLNEARVGIALQHSNVVDVIRASSVGDEPEIIMQYLHGWTLASLLSAVRSRRNPIDLEVAVAICHAIASGAAHLHERGLVHRHLTPANVMLTTDGCTKLIDFGGAISGKKKPASRYTAPEFFRNKRAVDARGDVYSVGAILYELTTGQVLFAGVGKPTDKIMRGDYPAPTRCRSDYPGLLAAILKRCMRLDVKGRYQDMDALLEALENFASEMRYTLSPRVVRNYAQMHLKTPAAIDRRRMRTEVEEVIEFEPLTLVKSAKRRKKAAPPPIPDARITSLKLATV
jgi:serine/threonine protein kinase